MSLKLDATETHQGGIGARACTQITRNHSWKNAENEMKIAWHISLALWSVMSSGETTIYERVF